MVQETQAERFREHLLQALQSGIQVNSDRAWSLGWAPSEDIIFDVLTPNHLKTKFNSRSEALRQSLVKVLLAEPDSEDKVQAWRDSKKALTEISELVATAKQREDEYTQPVFADHSDIAQRNQRRTLLQAEFASGSELEISSEILGSDLTQAETQIVGQLLTEWNQSAVLCDHVNVCTASEMAKQKRRLMLISDYRISFCRSTCKINRLPVAATIFLLDVIRIEIDDEFNIIRVIARDDDFYIFARSSSQFKVIMETLVKQFGLVLSGYPSAERVQLPSSYVLSKEPYLTAFESIKRTFEALVDRSGMMLNDFLRCVQSNFEYGKKALNLKEVIGAQPDQRALYAALLVACQALRYNCLEFEELIASYMPFGDTGMHAVSKLFTPSTVFASVDISNTSCSQKSMQILSEAIQKSSLPHLRCLNISDNPIGNAGVAMILTALRIADLRLEILACRKCGLSQKGFENLGRYLTEAKSLKVVDFSSNMPGKSGLNPLFEGFMACENIERIYLSNCGPQAKLATVLQSLVQNNPPKLKSLDVSNNRLSTQDAIQLSNLIKATDSLHELSLAHCKLRQAETNTIADAIASNQVEHLKFVLDLSRNSKHPKEESVWPLAIQTLTFPNGSGNLYALNLSDCKLTPEEFILVCEGLKSVKPLTVLSLNGSIKTGLFNKETCAKAGAAIADLMRCKQSLRMLSLSGTKNGMLGSPGINPVLEALVNNTSLYCLIISNNNLSKSSYSILRRLLRVNTTLQYLAVDYNRPALSSLWQLTGGFISSGSVCSSVPRNDFVNCIVSEKTRDVVEVLSSAIHRKFECNLRKNPMLFQSLEALIFSIPWIPRPRLCAGHLNKSDLEDFTSECALPAFYHELTQIHLYECGIPFVLTQLGDRVRSRNGLRTREIFGISELSVKYRRALNAFYNGRLELINDVQCCAHLITEYLGNRNPILSSLSCEQMNSALNVGTALLILDSELRAQERCIFFWLCDLLNDVLEMSEYNGADAHSLSILFTSCLYPMESWLENEYEKFQLTVPLFIETCIKLRSR